ncbi:MAG: hypothetical protein E5X67_00045 [Mesorhizobium sp.]|nr:MAG: hypothetical protein E5X67_00045 [Mesorhizobium sp.]
MFLRRKPAYAIWSVPATSSSASRRRTAASVVSNQRCADVLLSARRPASARVCSAPI